jgi:hypothetical protein
MHAKAGDWLIVETSTQDRHSVRGRIEEVLSNDGQPPYRVRWTYDDHISVVFPGSDARVVTIEDLEAIDRGQAKRYFGDMVAEKRAADRPMR